MSGCAAVREDRGAGGAVVCELPVDRVLRVWSPSRFARFFAAGGGAAALDAVVVREPQGGALFRVTVPAGATELRVVAGAGTDRVIRVGTKTAPAWLERAKTARQKGETDVALALAKTAEASADPVERAFGLGLRARMELAANRSDVAFPLFRESASLHRKAGRLSDAADDSFALAFALNQRSHHYTEARALLDDVRAWVGPYPDGRARESYYRGQLAVETGDARSAFELLREAREHALRLGLAVLERNALNAYALELELVGRRAEALDTLRKLAADLTTATDAGPCEKVEVAINHSFGVLLGNDEATVDEHRVDPSSELEAALAATDAGCKDRYLRSAVLGNLALAALQRGDVAIAKKRLAAAREGATEARAVEMLFWHDLDGHIALEENDAKRALASFDEEVSLAESILSFEGQWRGQVGRGTALERLERRDEALERYRAAEELLTTLSFVVPLGEGRGTFVGDRAKSARLAVDLLVRANRPAEALGAARAARARVIAGLARTARVEGLSGGDRARWEKALGAYRDARAALDAEAKDDWKLTRADAVRARAAREKKETELRAALDAAFALFAESGTKRAATMDPLPKDSLTLTFHPVRRGWVGLASDGTTASAFLVSRLPPTDDLASAASTLLEPVHAQLARATRLRVLPYGALRTVDFHALPFEGAPLVERLPIEYPLDLPRARPSRPDTSERAPLALVVGDPTLDLAKARAEAEGVAGALRDAGAFRVEVLAGRDATSTTVLAGLATATHLHYAGHGVFAGREGWESALPLAGGGHLAMSDVLATHAVPARIVLSGCETARTGAEAPSESLGLAQAFVIAGADFVIAPVRRVDDAVAAKTSEALYGVLAQAGSPDAAKALRDAQLARRRAAPDSDWSAFRVVTR